MYISFNCLSQEQYTTDLVNTRENHPTEWISYIKNDKISIEYKYIECNPSIGYDSEFIVFKITNLSAGNITLNWNMNLYYNGVCKTCDYLDEYGYSLTIPKGQDIEGDCTLESIHQVKIFSKFIDSQAKNTALLTAFEFGNLTLTEISAN